MENKGRESLQNQAFMQNKNMESFLSNRGIKRLAQLLAPINRTSSFNPNVVREEFLQWYKSFIKIMAIMTVNSGRITIQEGAVQNALEIMESNGGIKAEQLPSDTPPVGERLLNSAPLFRLAKQIIKDLDLKEGPRETNGPAVALRITNGAKNKIYNASIMQILQILKAQSQNMLS